MDRYFILKNQIDKKFKICRRLVEIKFDKKVFFSWFEEKLFFLVFLLQKEISTSRSKLDELFRFKSDGFLLKDSTFESQSFARLEIEPEIFFFKFSFTILSNGCGRSSLV